MKNLLTIVSILLISTVAFAQGEYNNWCFGDSTWLDFNSGTPLQYTCSTNSYGAASTMSDKNGILLFYVDKDTIWDASHNPMFNGLVINAVGWIQSVNTLPFPCNDSLYYVFYFSGNSGQDLEYSVINMNGNGGLGEVIQNNVSLDSNMTPNFGMTRHSNNMNYWIVYQKNDTNILYARQISSSGIGAPIISQLGTNKYSAHGSLKFSSNGAHLINCSRYDQFVEHYDFDNGTGVLSNAYQLNIPISITYNRPISSQFSPDLSKL